MVNPATRRKLESEAEVLAASQLDLLAQIEAQLRAVHHLMRRIEPLRARSEGQPSEAMTNGERADTLTGLSGDLEAIEQQLSVQLGCCEDMLATIALMRQRLPALKQAAGLIEQTGFPLRTIRIPRSCGATRTACRRVVVASWTSPGLNG